MEDILLTTPPVTRSGPEQTVDYGKLLEQAGLPFTRTHSYLQVGTPKKTQGWIIHLSVVKTQLDSLLAFIAPELADDGVAFRIPSDKSVAEHLIAGIIGYHQLAKVVTIYPETDEQAAQLARTLVATTQGFKGPAIPTDRHLGSIVYTRYGGFQQIYQINAEGKTEQFIYNAHGELIKDSYSIPFSPPVGIPWPFAAITTPLPARPATLRSKKYIPVRTLKADFKGHVIKALDIRRWRDVGWCLIKEGKANMCSDEKGRDIRDRLRWQFEVHSDLHQLGCVPRPVEYFQLNGDSYFAMEFIEGRTLREILSETLKNTCWRALSAGDRTTIADHLLRLVDALRQLHEAGYVHRDINPGNILSCKDSQLVFIDLELAYSTKSRYPFPPFQLGTFGYMSPQQLAASRPQKEEDIYGLGATLLESFTGIAPVKFDTSDNTKLRLHILHFVGDENLVELIAACLNPVPAHRPALNTVRNALLATKNQKQDQSKTEQKFLLPEHNTLEALVNHGLNALASHRFTNAEGIWLTAKSRESEMINNFTSEYTIYPGLFDGLSGILFVISEAKEHGIDITPCEDTWRRNMDYLLASDIRQMHPGLWFGTAGLAVAVSKAISTGLLENNEETSTFLKNCLLRSGNELSLSRGLAGQGLGLLACRPECWNWEALRSIVQTLIGRQRKDGSWNTANNLLGLADGIAGIVFFLMKYGSVHSDGAALSAAHRGLSYLEQKIQRVRGRTIWPVHTGTKECDPWLDNGFTGISSLYIKAYEVYKTERYRELAETVLANHPEMITANSLGRSSGLAGLGEVYLKAYRAFGNEQWKQRAGWIAGVLQATAQHQGDQSYWLQNYTVIPLPGLMNGNAGILYFLFQYLKVGREQIHIHENNPKRHEESHCY